MAGYCRTDADAMKPAKLLYSSSRLEPTRSGILCSLTPAALGGERIHFAVRQIAAGDSWTSSDRGRERCLVLLQGLLRVAWDGESHRIGPRASVFAAYPYAVYLPAGSRPRVEAIGPRLLEDCRGRSPTTFAA